MSGNRKKNKQQKKKEAAGKAAAARKADAAKIEPAKINQNTVTVPPPDIKKTIPTPMQTSNHTKLDTAVTKPSPLHKSKHFLFPWRRFFEVTGVLSGVVYAVITYYSWKDLRHNFMVDERAWLKMEIAFPQRLQDTQIPLKIVNVGKSVALRAETYAGLEIVNSQNTASFSYKSIMTTSHVQVIFPTSQANLIATRFHPQGDVFPLTESERTDLANGDAYVVVYGQITYQDQFGLHWTRFCYWHAYNNSPNDPTPKFNAESCSDYNGVGEEEGREALSH